MIWNGQEILLNEFKYLSQKKVISKYIKLKFEAYKILKIIQKRY